MKHTLLVTQSCNLACSYCYIGQRKARMGPSVARGVVDFMYRHTPPSEKLEIGFFGGEPLLEFDLIRDITKLIESHRDFDPCRVQMTIVTNGTIFSDRIADFVLRHDMGFGISCDGPPDVQNRFRRFHSGRGTAARVEQTIREAQKAFSAVMVNAVYGPATLVELPRTVEYFSSLGVRQIYLNPDFGAHWTQPDVNLLPDVFGALAKLYVKYYLEQTPHFISPIDSKIAVILRQGYHPLERCRMGRGEFAFTPNGDIYPCERLVGDGINGHCIGNVREGIKPSKMLCHTAAGDSVNRACTSCSLRDYCMNWCGCSNYFSTGFYNQVSPFLCASERAAIGAAFDAFQTLEKEVGTTFFEHLHGAPLVNSLLSPQAKGL